MRGQIEFEPTNKIEERCKKGIIRFEFNYLNLKGPYNLNFITYARARGDCELRQRVDLFCPPFPRGYARCKWTMTKFNPLNARRSNTLEVQKSRQKN